LGKENHRGYGALDYSTASCRWEATKQAND
jgi:hypothetical protein